MRHSKSGHPLKPPSPFKGESALRAKMFLANLKLVFYSAEEHRASKRIAYAVKYLEGEAKTLWDRKYSSRDIDSLTWEDFETFVNESVGDPGFRMLMAAVDYENAYQEEGETARDFDHRLFRLEFELGDFTEAQKTRQFLAKLTPDTRATILVSAQIPETRVEMVARAERIEMVRTWRDKEQAADAQRSRSRSRRSRKRKRPSG